ncbi:MAG: MarR family transcriptional regulator [Candidatus Nanopelagicales bacterium]
MTNWLSEEQQKIWRSWMSATALLPEQLGRDLQRDSGLTNADYEILVWLSEFPDRRIRMSDLADRTLSSRSRLSHQIDRMERAGLVSREVCENDRRGSFAVLTDKGWELLVSAAPAHVESVRRHLVDVLTPEEFEALGRACSKVSEHLQSLQS